MPSGVEHRHAARSGDPAGRLPAPVLPPVPRPRVARPSDLQLTDSRVQWANRGSIAAAGYSIGDVAPK
jgi:hypothetical protein